MTRHMLLQKSRREREKKKITREYSLDMTDYEAINRGKTERVRRWTERDGNRKSLRQVKETKKKNQISYHWS